MRTRRLLAVMPVLICLAAGEALAADVSGQQLLTLCTAGSNTSASQLDVAECTGFVAGVANAFDCVEDNQGFHWNSDAQVNEAQLVAVVVDWLHAHPAALAGEGRSLVGAALQAAFPCGSAALSN